MTNTSPPTPPAPTTERWPTLQHYMNTAHDEWQRADARRGRGSGFLTALSCCNPAETAAMLFGKLNYQVENGGFSQWTYNNYVDSASLNTLIDMIRTVIGAEQEAGRDAAAAETVLGLVREYRLITRRYGAFDRSQSDHNEERFNEYVTPLDDKYYAVSADWMDTAERYMSATYPIPPKPEQISHREALREVLDSLGALSNPSELCGRGIDERTQRLILEAAERPE